MVRLPLRECDSYLIFFYGLTTETECKTRLLFDEAPWKRLKSVEKRFQFQLTKNSEGGKSAKKGLLDVAQFLVHETTNRIWKWKVDVITRRVVLIFPFSRSL